MADSNSVVATGRRSFFYTYDMVAGKVDYIPGVLGREEKSWESHFVSRDGKKIAFLGNDGYIVLIDPLNKQATGTLKLNGSVRSLAFTDDGRHLLASGSDGDITRQVLFSRGRFFGFCWSYACRLWCTDGTLPLVDALKDFRTTTER